jgi:hypothetical protein
MRAVEQVNPIDEPRRRSDPVVTNLRKRIARERIAAAKHTDKAREYQAALDSMLAVKQNVARIDARVDVLDEFDE